MRIKLSALFIFLLVLSFCSQSPKPEKIAAADLILKNGEVYTMEEGHPWASSVIITGKKIIAVLDKDQPIKPYTGPNTKVIDLKGKFVVPGFIDGKVIFER
ncbi:MAG: hypothetical protein GY950_01245 [bacterium]|nr:hypothetical protein [bacterium]